ncbi:hypothetical protein TWF569_005518 [Orbilia oligospora]|uniref:Uncharacterized protein n=3 Tax=Orbilia oligospora TaxID=2813651 RepID=A0A7C8NX71_ORBOL|nr:hypothetical protein TWF102_011404 [Orbilia oligospora]KAF3115724.1 hypothetical protein TWF706_005831 [Orbilia oligospora]KAF3117986.1 hypothetical protein TWF103_000027 [Orbilia oligospora]KAF3141441.1 hypothetical protein TWF594_005998 [Orbilia oligospora]KAF3144182.1 hypothetical protein TWF703_009477 [Orbilia oligospora]
MFQTSASAYRGNTASQNPSSGDNNARSDALKSQGNIFFGKQDFQAALTAYSQAIGFNPRSAALYSNRSATYLQLGQLEQALADADKAVQFDPTWSKAYRRRGNVLEVLDRLDEAIDAYWEGKNNETDQAVKADLARMIAAVERRIEERAELKRRGGDDSIMSVNDAPAKLIAREIDRRISKGETPGQWPPLGSAARRLWTADMQYTEALRQLSQFQKHNLPAAANAPPGAFGISGPLQTLADLTSVAMEDFKVVYFGEGDLEKLQLCYMLEQQQRNAIGDNLNPVQTIAEYKNRLDKGASWDIIRPALQLSIRAAFMNGIIKDGFLEPRLPNGTTPAVDDFRRAVDLTEEARRVFNNVPGHIRGRTLEITFLRGLKIRLGEALIKLYNHTDPPSLPIIEEIKNLGDYIVSSCNTSPLPEVEPPTNQETTERYWDLYVPHWGYPRAMGHIFRGMAYMQLGLHWNRVQLDSRTGKKGPSTGNMGDLRTAAEEYVSGAAWLPDDDVDATNALWMAIFCMVRRGAYYLGDLQLLRTMALHQQGLWGPWFGADYIPAGHSGKLASSEALRQSEGADPDTICSPLVEWSEGVEVDQDILGEVLMPYIGRALQTPEKDGGGMIMLGKIIRSIWEERKRLGEPRVGALWDGLPSRIRVGWEGVWKMYEKERLESRQPGLAESLNKISLAERVV